MNDDDARHHTVSNVGAREQRTAFIAYQHDIARLNAACLSIRRIDPARFAVFNIGKMMTGRTVKLAVHAVAALACHQCQGRVLGLCVDAFGRYKVARMPQAVCVLVAGDLRRIKLNQPAFRIERVCLRILAEVFKCDELAVFFSNIEEHITLLPEVFEVRSFTPMRSPIFWASP